MPWRETCVMDQRLRFIVEYLEEIYDMTTLCNSYGISRKTGYKWVRRYEDLGIEGLKEQSRRPHSHPERTDDETREWIIQTKLAHQSFGPKKVMDYLRREAPGHGWPADSTAGEILKRAGLVRKKKRRVRMNPDSQPFNDCQRPNAVWSVDFKGHFALGNGQRCYPLTLTDNYSRYLLQCRGLSQTKAKDVRPWLEWSFREYGLPEAIRSDNGPPFASLALGGISALSKWWIQLGIKPERIMPGKPQQNGRHERMHRSLKAGTVRAKYNITAQQRAFNAFMTEYNEQRSHESLARKRPIDIFETSPRPYPARLPAVDYDTDCDVRRVKHSGEISWRTQLIYISQVLAGEDIGLKQINEDCWSIYFGFYRLGFLDVRKGKTVPLQNWHAKETENV